MTFVYILNVWLLVNTFIKINELQPAYLNKYRCTWNSPTRKRNEMSRMCSCKPHFSFCMSRCRWSIHLFL
jgi:hypothetical protein